LLPSPTNRLIEVVIQRRSLLLPLTKIKITQFKYRQRRLLPVRLALQGCSEALSEALSSDSKAPVGVRAVLPMSTDKKKTLEEIEAEMDALTGRLSALRVEHQAARQRQSYQPSRESLSEQEQYKALLRKMVGRRVIITVKGPHRGKEGVIT